MCPRFEVRSCATCGFAFRAKPSSRARYCRRACYDLAHAIKDKMAKCEVCESSFEKTTSLARRFCSKACYLKDHSAQTKTLKCRGCDAEVKNTPGRDHTFCSRRCLLAWRAKNRVILCECCAKPFKRQQASRSFCSMACRNAGNVGAANPNWRGYLTNNGDYERYTATHPQHANRYVHWVVWHEANPDGLCEDCGREAHHVHHVDHNQRNNSPENLRGLCGSCHRKTHRREAAA